MRVVSTDPPAPGMAMALADLHRAIDAVAAQSAQATGVTAEQVRSVERAMRRIEAIKLTLIATADRERAADTQAHTSTSSWVDQVTRSGGAAAAAQVTLATHLADTCPQTRAALAAGEVTSKAAAIITSTMERLPDGLAADDRAKVEAALVRDARVTDPARLRRMATRALAAATASQDEVDAHQDELLRTQEERAYAASRLTLFDNGDGTTSGRFTVPTLAAAMLRKVIHAMTSPRRDFARAGEARGDGSRVGGSRGDRPQVGGSRGDGPEVGDGPAGRDADWREISWQEKAGRAFVDLLEHLPTEGLGSKNSATVVVTMQLESLLGGLRAAGVETGTDLSAGEVRRLACGAGLVPAVLDGVSLPVDLGRQKRHFNDNQRALLAGFYDACAAEGCDRPYAWCELHHDRPWHAGGRTDLGNAIPLCGFHHRLIEGRSHRSDVAWDGPVATVRFHRRE